MKADVSTLLAARRVAAAAAALVTLCAAIVAGCERPAASSRNSGAQSAPTEQAVRLDSPQQTAHTLLTLLREELRAIRRGDRDAQRRCHQQLEQVADRDSIQRRFARTPQVKMLLGEDVVAGVIGQWGATIAYYAEGLELEALQETAASAPSTHPAPGREQEVRVRGRGKAGEPAWIRVRCVQGTDGLWRVTHMDFAGRRAAAGSQAATQTAP